MTAALEARFVSKSAYARHRDVSPQMVGQWAKANRIKIVEGRVDVIESDAMLARSLDPARGGKGGKSRRAGHEAAPAGPAKGSEKPEVPLDPTAASFQQSRALREEYAAKRERTEYELSIGKLIQADRAALATATIYANVRRSSQRLGTVLGSRCAAESDPRKCRLLIDAEVESMLAELADKIAGLPGSAET